MRAHSDHQVSGAAESVGIRHLVGSVVVWLCGGVVADMIVECTRTMVAKKSAVSVLIFSTQIANKNRS